MNTDDIKAIFVEISTPEIFFFVGSIYRQPQTNFDEFLCNVDESLSSVGSGSSYIIFGYFKVDSMKVDELNTLSTFI